MMKNADDSPLNNEQREKVKLLRGESWVGLFDADGEDVSVAFGFVAGAVVLENVRLVDHDFSVFHFAGADHDADAAGDAVGGFVGTDGDDISPASEVAIEGEDGLNLA
jgi:hypothetical protein